MNKSHKIIKRCSKPVAAISSKQWGDDMGSAEREPIPGVCGQSPHRGPGAERLVRGQGSKAPPPEAERQLNFDNTLTRLILH